MRNVLAGLLTGARIVTLSRAGVKARGAFLKGFFCIEDPPGNIFLGV